MVIIPYPPGKGNRLMPKVRNCLQITNFGQSTPPGNPHSLSPCPCEPRSAVAISCRLVPASIKKLCHCEPVRTLAWQSALPIPLSLRGSKSRGNLLSVGSCIYRTPMSLRASAHTGVAIRTLAMTVVMACFCVENDTLWGICMCSSSGGYLSCSGKKDTKEAGWGGFELIAPAIKATSPDPSRHALL